jgi:hypothetical protein
MTSTPTEETDRMDHTMDQTTADHRSSGLLVRAWARLTYRTTSRTTTTPTARTTRASDQPADGGGPLPAGGGFARLVLLATTATIAALTFAFSFGNVWVLDLYLGIDRHIAPLVGPAVDLSVIGLLITVQWLSLAGVTARNLRPGRRLLVACGLITMALNSAPSLVKGITTGEPRAYGRAAVEAIAPWLLIAWSHVGPYLLRLFVDLRRSATDRTMPGIDQPAAVVQPVADGVDQAPVDQLTPARSNHRTARPVQRSTAAVHMVWSPAIRAMADHLDRHYRDDVGRSLEIPSRRKVQAAMESNPGDLKWTSAGQVDQAIKAARSIRESEDRRQVVSA